MQDLIVPVLIGAFVIGLNYYSHLAKSKREEKRRGTWQAAANELGLDYEPSLSPPDFELFQRFGLAGEGRDKVSCNAIVADAGPIRMVMFDHRYINGSGKNKATFFRQVVMATGDDLRAPGFRISSDPRSFTSAISKLLGLKGNSLKFKNDSGFSNRFSFRGSHDVAVQDFFTPRRRAAFMQLPHSTWAVLECNASGFLLYKPRCEPDAEQLKALMNHALSLYQILREDESTAPTA